MASRSASWASFFTLLFTFAFAASFRPFLGIVERFPAFLWNLILRGALHRATPCAMGLQKQRTRYVRYEINGHSIEHPGLYVLSCSCIRSISILEPACWRISQQSHMILSQVVVIFHVVFTHNMKACNSRHALMQKSRSDAARGQAIQKSNTSCSSWEREYALTKRHNRHQVVRNSAVRSIIFF